VEIILRRMTVAENRDPARDSDWPLPLQHHSPKELICLELEQDSKARSLL